MEIEEFVEQDILIFLDERIDEPRHQKHITLKMSSPAISHDFESEFFAALDTKNISHAKQVLNNLKLEFDACPTSSADKVHLKSLLLDLYEKFKDYLDAQNTFAQIEHHLDGPEQATTEIEKEKILSKINIQSNNEPTPPPELLTNKNDISQKDTTQKNTSQKEALEKQAKKNSTEQTATIDIQELMTNARTALDKKDYMGAINHYKLLKRNALNQVNISESAAKQIVLLHDDILRTATQSKPPYNTQNSINKSINQNSTLTIEISKETPKTGDDNILLRIEQEKKELDKILKNNDMALAIQQYRKIKMLVQQIQDEKIKKSSEEKLIKIYTILRALKDNSKPNDTVLSKVIP